MWMIQGVIRSYRCLAAVSSEVTWPWSGRLITQRRYSQELERIFSVLDRCNLKELGQFLDQHPQAVNYRGGDKTTPLHYLAGASPWMGVRLPVCQEPPKQFVHLLLKRGADKEALNHRDQSPLHMAARVGYFGIATELIKKKQ